MNRLLFEFLYLFRPRWDTGIPAPELVRVVAAHPPGRALDIGCGTGANVRYLAEHGWQASGVDFVPGAIRQARRKLGRLAATLLVGDATRLSELPLDGPFDLALDMGCFHGLSPAGQAAYAAGLSRRLRPGGLYMLYAWQPDPAGALRGLTRAEVERAFAASFQLVNYEQGQGRPSAWYYFERTRA